jgi:hypothetical protein
MSAGRAKRVELPPAFVGYLERHSANWRTESGRKNRSLVQALRVRV